MATTETNQSPGTDDVVQEEDDDDIPDDASTAAQIDGTDEDIPDLVGLEMDRSSVDDIHTGSDAEDNTTLPEKSEDAAVRELGKTIGSDGPNSSMSEDKSSGRVNSSAATSDGGVDSDSKTLETVATSLSTDASTKDGTLQSPFLLSSRSNMPMLSVC